MLVLAQQLVGEQELRQCATVGGEIEATRQRNHLKLQQETYEEQRREAQAASDRRLSDPDGAAPRRQIQPVHSSHRLMTTLHGRSATIGIDPRPPYNCKPDTLVMSYKYVPGKTSFTPEFVAYVAHREERIPIIERSAQLVAKRVADLEQRIDTFKDRGSVGEPSSVTSMANERELLRKSTSWMMDVFGKQASYACRRKAGHV